MNDMASRAFYAEQGAPLFIGMYSPRRVFAREMMPSLPLRQKSVDV